MNEKLLTQIEAVEAWYAGTALQSRLSVGHLWADVPTLLWWRGIGYTLMPPVLRNPMYALRLVPESVTVPWQGQHDVPPGIMWLREKESEDIELVSRITRDGLWIVMHDGNVIKWTTLCAFWQWSDAQGRDWHDCTKEVR